MKLKLFLAFLLIHLYQSSNSQSKMLSFPQFHSKVVVFSEAYQDNLLNTFRGRFTPDSILVKEIETYLFENNIEKTTCRKNNFRQYIGYNKNGNSYVLVKILNFKNEKKLLKYFYDWRSKYAFILTDLENYPDISEYYFNTDLRSLSKFEWGRHD